MGKSRDLLLKDLEVKMKNGDITEDDAKQSLYVFDKVQQVSNAVKDLDVSAEDKATIASLLKKRDDIKVKMQNKDDVLLGREKQQVADINNQINEIILKPKEDAVQEQAAGQVPVQPGTGVGQEVAQGEPQAEPQGVTQEGQVQEEVAPTQQPDIEGEVSRLEQLFAEQETAPTQAAGVSISNDTDVEELRNRTQSKSQQATTQEEKNSADTKVKIIDTAKKAIKTLKSVFPDVDIVIHDDEGSYNAYQKLDLKTLFNEQTKLINWINKNVGQDAFDTFVHDTCYFHRNTTCHGHWRMCVIIAGTTIHCECRACGDNTKYCVTGIMLYSGDLC